MLKNHWRVISRIERFTDNFLIISTFVLAYYWRDTLVDLLRNSSLVVVREPLTLGPITDYLVILGVALPLYNAMISTLGGYRSMRFSSLTNLLRLAVVSSALVFLSVSAFLFLLKLDLSRSFVGIFCIGSGLVILTERYVVLLLLRYWRVRGRNFRNILIVGTGAQARKLYLEVCRQPELGVRVAGFVSLPAAERDEADVRLLVNGDGQNKHAGAEHHSETYDLSARVVADIDGFEAALKKHAVDEVVFTDVIRAYAAVQELAQISVEEGVRVTLAADLFSLEIFRSDMSYLGKTPLIHYQPSPGESTELAVKRFTDICISALLLALLGPLLMIPAAVAIKLNSKGPVFFKQKRVGLNGRLFTLLKFRSMVVNAEELLEALKERNEMQGPVFKLTEDPRVTRVGKWLRRFSIDELPQLWNVLKGDMSLVGPRPPLPEEVSYYRRKQRRRLSMRPGLTCIWQVSGRNNIPDFEKWAKLDLDYIDNWSLMQDVKLLLKTIPVVLSGFGAR